jgi:hypothetical protein
MIQAHHLGDPENAVIYLKVTRKLMTRRIRETSPAEAADWADVLNCSPMHTVQFHKSDTLL